MGFPVEAADVLVERTRLVRWAAGERILAPNDRDDAVHLVAHGSVRLVCSLPGRAPATVCLLGPGRFFGLASLFDRPGPRLLGAVAHERCVVAVVSQRVVMDLLATLPPERAFQLLAYSWRVLSSIIYHKTRALALPLPERVLSELRLLGCDFGRPHPRGVRLDVPLPTADLAALVGCSAAKAGRVLGTLRAAGVIAEDAGRLLLLDPTPRSERAAAVV
jgi:CRP-like cAMP-binding protein